MECRFRHKCWSWKIKQILKKISLLSVLFKSDVWFQIIFLFKFKYWSASLRFLLSKHVTKGWYECQKTKTFILIRHFIILIITGAHNLQLRMFFVWHIALLKGKYFFKINHIWSNPTQFCEDAAMLSSKRMFLIKAMPWNVKSPNLQEWNSEWQERSYLILVWGTSTWWKEKSHRRISICLRIHWNWKDYRFKGWSCTFNCAAWSGFVSPCYWAEISINLLG